MRLRSFANCIPVRGVSRSVICDLQLQQIKLVPNSLAELLEKHQGKTVEEIKEAYSNEYDEIIDEYIEFLEEHEFIFFTENPEHFPDLSMEWDEPFPITNMIVDYSSSSEYEVNPLLSQIDDINCKHIQLRFFNELALSNLKNYLEHIKQREGNN